MRSIMTLFIVIVLSAVPYKSHPKTTEFKIEGVGSIIVHVDRFEPEKHRIKICGDYICLIDGSPFFGSDGKMPSEKMKMMVFSHKKGSTNLDVSAMYDPSINNQNIRDRISIDRYWGEFYIITGRFSDGAGAYISQWIVTDDGSIRTHISDTETAYELFKELSPGKKRAGPR